MTPARHDVLAAGELAAFQDAFATALLAPLTGAEPPAGMHLIWRQPGFAIHRNTVIKGCIDTLVDAFPAVTRLVGEEWMRAACARHVAEAIPGSPVLLDYGASFPAFLDRFEPAAELPYLPGVARLDRAWLESHVAAEAPPIDVPQLAALDDDALARARLGVHPSVRIVASSEHPLHTIWLRNREPDGRTSSPIDWKGECALVVRRDGVVRSTALDAPGRCFLDACRAGATIGECARAAWEADPACAPAERLHFLLHHGALVAQESLA